MSAPARLLGLRIQGFKSFAERTLVEFGPGISAVVGPNGSGKSNLADALRWALGEQGRSLRIRKSEDVIWAGSEKRSALGMADVTLVLDNADALLPVEFSVVELGRRLYRSGENDYLLNRQRVRLRDLVDLLDGANLAENAFLFIGQGMVDQALALRPEERRPLFEEVAGVRRHERRRRKAEEQLAEAESNLARVEDILAELRPQARRLGQLAEQQATRLTAGEELAAALIVAAHGRWHDAAGRAANATARRDALRAGTDAALVALEAAEDHVAAIAASMAERADAERERRAVHDAARVRLTELGLREARANGELAAAARDRARALAERAAAEAEAGVQRRVLAEATPERDLELEAALAEADRSLAEALAELVSLRAASRARGDELTALRRAEAARAAEAETARRRLAESDRRAKEEAAKATAASLRRDQLEATRATAHAALGTAAEAEAAAQAAREATRTEADARDAARRAAAERAARAGSLLAAARGRLESLEQRLAEEEQRGIARGARKLGGARVDQDLGVDPGLRAAVEAALGELARAYVVAREAAAALGGERGHLVVRERLAAGDGASLGAAGGATGAAAAEVRRLEARLAEIGGGWLRDAVRRDPLNAVRPLLARAAWVPDLAAALDLQALLPAGWLAVTRDGSAVVDAVTVRLGVGDSVLERRAEGDRLAREVKTLSSEADAAEAETLREAAAVGEGRAALERARLAESAAAADRRRAEEAERTAGRGLEAAAREAGWHVAQAERLVAEATRLRDALAALDRVADTGPSEPGGANEDERQAVAAWDARVAELRIRRDRVAADVAEGERVRRDADARRARAEAAVTLAQERMGGADRELVSLSEQERAFGDERDAVAADLAAASSAEASAREALDALLADDAAERRRLAEAEREATAARERLRSTDDRTRAADVSALEARLNLDALREQLLVELAGLGEVGIRHLVASAGDAAVTGAVAAAEAAPDATRPASVGLGDGDGIARDDADDALADADAARSEDSGRLEAAIDALAPRWAADAPDAEPPAPGRLAILRRRYHELGAANPFAVDEFRVVRERLETLASQDRDLREAIMKTRVLIADLDTLIATQFRTTFAALEDSFDRRFQQLFGGGFAKLSLTDPSDLSSTGIEIVARPPGKKPQALAMLSGGERALTAVALLFAMLEVRPVPFCVLDEVDAALDEANVGRFTDALRDLSAATQFIVITHNRGTISSADALYGVTVGDDSVSRVISLRLDEAHAIADGQRGASRAVPAGAAD